MQQAEKISGEFGFDLAGPIGGAIGEAVPTAVSELLGLKLARTGRRVAGSTPDPEAQAILQAGERADVPVLTTDLRPPDTFAGKFLQQTSEKLGPVGSGSARQTQQLARENAVVGLADEFGVELDSSFGDVIVKSIGRKSARTLEEAGAERLQAVSTLDTFGEVPLTNTIQVVSDQLAAQARLGARADTGLVKSLEDTLSALRGGDFSLLKDIRSEVISDLRAIGRGEDTRALGAVQDLKSAIDKDMVSFARANDPNSARLWLRSNRAFAEELTNIKDTELKRILSRGDATPEVVIPVLKGGKVSELNRLNNSMGAKGQAAARSAIIQDALQESGYFSDNINPDRLANALLKPNRQKAIGVFFSAEDKAQLDGFIKLLNSTRRAQQAAAAPATGIQTIPLISGSLLTLGLTANPFMTLTAVGTLAGFAKAYESGPVRSLLLRLDRAEPGSALETSLLEAATPLVLEGLQAARTESEQIERRK